MQIGDKFRVRPVTIGVPDKDDGGIRTGTVVYIHPENRYMVLKFRSKFGNNSFLESFPIPGGNHG